MYTFTCILLLEDLAFAMSVCRLLPTCFRISSRTSMLNWNVHAANCAKCMKNSSFRFSECTGSGDCIQSYTSETIFLAFFCLFSAIPCQLSTHRYEAIVHQCSTARLYCFQLQRPLTHRTARDRRAGPQLNPVRHIACTAAVHAAFHTDISLLLICIFHLRRIR